MLGDYRPGYSLWRRHFPGFTVVIVQGEGGDLLEQDVQDGFRLMKKTIVDSSKYITFYDLTDCMQNLWPQAPALIKFAVEMKKYSLERQIAVVTVCPDEKVRNWVRWILSIAASSTPYHIFQSCGDAWNFVESIDLSRPTPTGADVFGAEATLPTSLSATASQPAFDFGAIMDTSFLTGLL